MARLIRIGVTYEETAEALRSTRSGAMIEVEDSVAIAVEVGAASGHSMT
jgi:hypothetical protein